MRVSATEAKPSPALARLLQWATDSYCALRLAGFSDEAIARIIRVELDDRLPAAKPYPEPDIPRDTEPPEVSSDEFLLKPWTESALIAEALKDGREPEDISVVNCDQCASTTYYNDGSHCACEHCGANLDHLVDGDDREVTSLADHIDALASAEDGGLF
jgi:hypothetical protein